MNENMEFNPDRPLQMGELEWRYISAAPDAIDHAIIESSPVRIPPRIRFEPFRFSAEFRALLCKRFANFKSLSQESRFALCERNSAEHASLIGTNIFNSTPTGVHLRFENLPNYATDGPQ